MQIKNKILLGLLIILAFQGKAQSGGTSTFSLLDLGYSARANALGTNFITVKDQDLSLGIINPSLYNKKMHNIGVLSQSLLAGGINYGMMAYAKNFDSLGLFAANIRYVNYGKMIHTDETGVKLGEYNPSEYIAGIGYAKSINPLISTGANLNLIYSQLSNYNSFGVSLDLGGAYHNEKTNFMVTALVKNFGFQLNTYIQKSRASLPVNFQVGISKKLQHAPFRFSMVVHHLNKWNITYLDPSIKPTIDALTGDTIPIKQPSVIEKIGHHFIFQTEILLSKSIHIRAAFDYHKRQEMKLVQRPGMSGFSFGTGLYFKRFSIDYGVTIFSKAGMNNMITISSNLANWKK